MAAATATATAAVASFSTSNSLSCCRTNSISSLARTSRAFTSPRRTRPAHLTQFRQQSQRAPRQQYEQRRNISAYGYEQAKSLVYQSHGEPSSALKLHGHSISPPHSSLLTVRFLASPINPADINTIQGVYPQKPAFTTSLGTSEPVAVPGNEGVAEVISAGSSALTPEADGGRKFQKGDWVIMKGPGFGTWRTHAQTDVAANPGQFIVLSAEEREGLSPLAAAMVSVNPCTAWAMLKGYVGGKGEQAGRELKEGEWFIQNGANSGVGRAAIQLAREWGAKSINIIRSRPEGAEATQKLKDELVSLGANVVLTEEEATEKGFTDRVKEITNGGRETISVGLNCVGGRSALNLAKVLDAGAWHLTYGAMAKQPLSIPAGMLIFKDLRFGGFWVSRWSDHCVEEKREAVREILRLVREGKFKDAPVQEVKWTSQTDEKTLVDAVQGTLDGFRAGKGVFVFEET